MIRTGKRVVGDGMVVCKDKVDDLNSPRRYSSWRQGRLVGRENPFILGTDIDCYYEGCRAKQHVHAEQSAFDSELV